MFHCQRKITLLEDNHPGALYNYLIHVQTGHRRNAGTTANVFVFFWRVYISLPCRQPGDSADCLCGTVWTFDRWIPGFSIALVALSSRSQWGWSAQEGRVTHTPWQTLTSLCLREEPPTCSCWPLPTHSVKSATSGCSTTTLEVTRHGTRG